MSAYCTECIPQPKIKSPHAINAEQLAHDVILFRGLPAHVGKRHGCRPGSIQQIACFIASECHCYWIFPLSYTWRMTFIECTSCVMGCTYGYEDTGKQQIAYSLIYFCSVIINSNANPKSSVSTACRSRTHMFWSVNSIFTSQVSLLAEYPCSNAKPLEAKSYFQFRASI